MDDQNNAGTGQDAPQTDRFVKVSFSWNDSSQSLSLLSSSASGSWVTAPPTYIPASTGNLRGNPHNWESEGPNAGGQVTYQIGSSSSQLTMTWSSVDGATNSYSISSNSSSAASLTVSGNDGVSALVTYVA